MTHVDRSSMVLKEDLEREDRNRRMSPLAVCHRPLQKWETPDGMIHATCYWANDASHMRTLACNYHEVISSNIRAISVDVMDGGLGPVTCLECLAGSEP